MPRQTRRRPSKVEPTTASGRLAKRIVILPDGRYLLLYSPSRKAN